MPVSLNVPQRASPAQLASAFSLSPAFSSSAPSPADVLNNTQHHLDAVPLLAKHWAVSGHAPNTNWVADPFDTKNREDVLQVTYPRNTREGTQFVMKVFDEYQANTGSAVQTALLKYEVAFSEDFDYVLGGKLPGLYGQRPHTRGFCSGGRRREDCFSARLMWREKGAGEVYTYMPTYTGFCGQDHVFCTDGISLSRGSWRFKQGRWTTITQLIALNTPGYANGLLYLYADNKLVLNHTNLTWRIGDDVTLSSVFFSTFFGGSSDAWNSKGGTGSFRRFEVYASPFASNTTGPAVRASASGGRPVLSEPSSPSDKRWATVLNFLILSSLILQYLTSE
ncbi:hypothetical protein JCM8547_005763 [Rhodosporidiobolus lusitaniae]